MAQHSVRYRTRTSLSRAARSAESDGNAMPSRPASRAKKIRSVSVPSHGAFATQHHGNVRKQTPCFFKQAPRIFGIERTTPTHGRMRRRPEQHQNQGRNRPAPDHAQGCGLAPHLPKTETENHMRRQRDLPFFQQNEGPLEILGTGVQVQHLTNGLVIAHHIQHSTINGRSRQSVGRSFVYQARVDQDLETQFFLDPSHDGNERFQGNRTVPARPAADQNTVSLFSGQPACLFHEFLRSLRRSGMFQNAGRTVAALKGAPLSGDAHHRGSTGCHVAETVRVVSFERGSKERNGIGHGFLKGRNRIPTGERRSGGPAV